MMKILIGKRVFRKAVKKCKYRSFIRSYSLLMHFLRAPSSPLQDQIKENTRPFEQASKAKRNSSDLKINLNVKITQ